MKRSPAFIISVAILAIFVVVSVFAPLLAPYGPNQMELRDRLMPPFWQEGGSTDHILGTDQMGRDILSRIIYGARTSLAVCLLAILFSGGIGTLVGIVSGYLGGTVDTVIMRIVDLWLSIPMILLALVFAVTLGPSFTNIIIVLALVMWTRYARLARGTTLKVKEEDFVALAKIAGCSKVRIMIRHILPNVSSSLVVVATIQAGAVIILESSLSFLGVGLPVTMSSWGMMIAAGRRYVTSAWWLSVIPGIVIMLTVLSFNLLGDGLNDYLNPVFRRQLESR